MADVSIPSGGTLADAFRSIGRARVLRSAYWDMSNDFAPTHLADMEGEAKVDPKSEMVRLTLPELTGPAAIELYEQGADPEVTLPLFLADPALRPILTPTGGTAGAGRSSRTNTAKHTLVLFPEEMFRKADGTIGTTVTFTKSSGAWKLDTVAFTTEQTRLLDKSIWLWKVVFTRPPASFRHADGGKMVETVTGVVMQDFEKPEGQQLYTIGDPADVGIDINPDAA